MSPLPTETPSRPLEFDPTRFNEDLDERMGAACLFMPFGAGAHPCVVRRFAVMEIALFVAEALQKFEWKLVDHDKRRRSVHTGHGEERSTSSQT